MNSTMIKVMIRTTVPPDSMATIEERKIEGLARPPVAQLMATSSDLGKIEAMILMKNLS